MKRRNNENALPKIRVILRDDKPINKEGKFPIEFVIRLNGSRKRKSSGLHIKAKYWNKRKQRAICKFLEHETINKILDTKIADFEQYFVRLSALGQLVNMAVVEEFFNDKRFDDFLTYFDLFIEECRPKLEDATIRKYTDCRKVFPEFLKAKGLRQVQFVDIDRRTIKEFDEYLIYKRKVTSGTAYNYHKPLKKLFNQAVEEEVINKTPYMGFKPIDTGKPKEKDVLTSREVMAIKELDFEESQLHLEKYRNIFLFLLNTGMRFSDVQSAKVSDIIGSGNTTEDLLTLSSKKRMPYLNIIQKKTNNPAQYVLNKEARYAMLKVRSLFDISSEKLFGEICLQPFNRYLKTIAKMAGIDKNLSTHVGRHSFGTKLHNSKNASMENIADLLGHKNSKMANVYVRKDVQVIAPLVENLYSFEEF